MKYKFTLIATFIVIAISVIAQTNEAHFISEYKRVSVSVFLPNEFPDGYSVWNDYLVKNLDTSLPSLKAAPIGNYTVPVSYTIDKDGKIKDIVASKNPGYGASEEVLRVIKNYKERIPVLQDGSAGEFHVKQFIQFKVVSEKLLLNEDGKVFTSVQIEAEFPGGPAAWKSYLVKNLNVNTASDKGAPAGKYTVLLSFLVDIDGSVSDVQSMNNPGYGTAEEAIRVIKNGPKWLPAEYGGHKVKYRAKQAITFVVSRD